MLVTDATTNYTDYHSSAVFGAWLSQAKPKSDTENKTTISTTRIHASNEDLLARLQKGELSTLVNVCFHTISDDDAQAIQDAYQKGLKIVQAQEGETLKEKYTKLDPDSQQELFITQNNHKNLQALRNLRAGKPSQFFNHMFAIHSKGKAHFIHDTMLGNIECKSHKDLFYAVQKRLQDYAVKAYFSTENLILFNYANRPADSLSD
jgi:hypothetical protein